MLLPANAGSGESDLVTARSAMRDTVVVAVAVLLAGVPSTVVLAAVTLLVMVVPLFTVSPTLTTMVKTAVSPLATEALEKTMLPVPPTDGAEVDQPVPVVTVA